GMQVAVEGRDLCDVLVAPAAQTDHDRAEIFPLLAGTQVPRDGVCALERGDDALEAREPVKCVQCVGVRNTLVLRAPALLQPRVLRSDAWIIETGRHGVGRSDLAALVLQQIAEGTVQNTRHS